MDSSGDDLIFALEPHVKCEEKTHEPNANCWRNATPDTQEKEKRPLSLVVVLLEVALVVVVVVVEVLVIVVVGSC